MSIQFATNALLVQSHQLIAPKPPRVSENIVDTITIELDSAVTNLDTVHEHFDNLKETFGGHSAFQDAEINVNNAQDNFQELAGYVNDLQQYATFWRRTAQKLMGKYEPTRPVFYKPFDEV
jgi:hypothetical protein